MEIIEIIENEDGSANIFIELTKEELTSFAKKYILTKLIESAKEIVDES